jgi:hypothetical protein
LGDEEEIYLQRVDDLLDEVEALEEKKEIEVK